MWLVETIINFMWLILMCKMLHYELRIIYNFHMVIMFANNVLSLWKLFFLIWLNIFHDRLLQLVQKMSRFHENIIYVCWIQNTDQLQIWFHFSFGQPSGSLTLTLNLLLRFWTQRLQIKFIFQSISLKKGHTSFAKVIFFVPTLWMQNSHNGC